VQETANRQEALMDIQPESLQAATDQYFRSCHGLKYPQALVSAFPRIANKIVQSKSNPTGLRTYFQTLINDERGNRKGFAFEVLVDIEDLSEFMLTQENGQPPDNSIKWF
jgi:hypothetical protein